MNIDYIIADARWWLATKYKSSPIARDRLKHWGRWEWAHLVNETKHIFYSVWRKKKSQ